MNLRVVDEDYAQKRTLGKGFVGRKIAVNRGAATAATTLVECSDTPVLSGAAPKLQRSVSAATVRSSWAPVVLGLQNAGGLLLSSLGVDSEAQHHAALVVLGDVAVSHPELQNVAGHLAAFAAVREAASQDDVPTGGVSRP